MLLQLGQVHTIVVSSQQVAKEVTHDVFFASRLHVQTTQIRSYNYGDIIFSPNRESWKQLGRISVSELLSTKRVQSFRSKREEEVTNLINWISSKGGSAINFIEKVYSLMCGITSRAAFGKKSREQEPFVSFIEETIRVAAGFSNVCYDLFNNYKCLFNSINFYYNFCCCLVIFLIELLKLKYTFTSKSSNFGLLGIEVEFFFKCQNI